MGFLFILISARFLVTNTTQCLIYVPNKHLLNGWINQGIRVGSVPVLAKGILTTTEKRLWVMSIAEEVRSVLHKIFRFLVKKFLTIGMSLSEVRNISEYLLHYSFPCSRWETEDTKGNKGTHRIRSSPGWEHLKCYLVKFHTRWQIITLVKHCSTQMPQC